MMLESTEINGNLGTKWVTNLTSDFQNVMQSSPALFFIKKPVN